MGRSIVLQNDTQLCIAMPELSSDEIDSCKCHSASDLGNRAYDYRIRKMPLIFEWISGLFIIYSNLEGLNRLLQRPAIQIFGISRQLPGTKKNPFKPISIMPASFSDELRSTTLCSAQLVRYPDQPWYVLRCAEQRYAGSLWY